MGRYFPPDDVKIAPKKKQPAIPLPHRLLAHMRRWHRQGAKYPVEATGTHRPITRMQHTFDEAVAAVRLKDVTPHTLRHTAATWMMQARVDVFVASGYLGMSEKTLKRIYAHHHPEHLAPPLLHSSNKRRATGNSATGSAERPGNVATVFTPGNTPFSLTT
jgi:integrase